MACTLAESPSDPLHRKLRQLRCLRCRFDCYRVERTSSRAGVAPAEVQRLFTAHFFANDQLAAYLSVNRTQLDASASYRKRSFDRIFPPTVFRGPKQSPTIRWICNRCADGRGVVTPRDVLDLLIRAKQRQQDIYAADPDGTSDHLIGTTAIQYGFEELS